MKYFALLVLCLLIGLPVFAADLYVDNTVGNDAFDGACKTVTGAKAGPFRTITRAAKAANPGDTVHVNPTGVVYRESVNLYGMKSGEPGKPITIDGQGVTLSGAEICPPEGWRAWKDDVVMRDDFAWKAAGGSAVSFAVVVAVDGKLIVETTPCDILQPGELCYIPLASNRLFYKTKDRTLPEIEVGQPDGASVKLDVKAWQASGMPGIFRYNGLKTPTWTKINGVETPLTTAKERLAPGQFTVEGNRLYFKPAPGKTVAKQRFEAIVRDNGIQMGGDTAYVVVKNITATHVANDGYNLHGNVKHVEFYNCNAMQCGDEGFSAHETCESLVDGAVYSYCDNASTNIVSSVTTIRNAIFAYSRHTGYEMQQQSKHVLQNVIFIDNPVQLGGAGSDLQMENVLMIRTAAGPATQALSFSGAATLRGVTVVGNTTLLRYYGGPGINLERCLFGPAQGLWHVRLDDATTPFTMKKVRFGTGSKMEYGSRQPFKTQTLEQWLAGCTDAAKAQDTAIEDVPGLADLVAGKLPAKLPEDLGCGKELLTRYLAFLNEARK